MVNKDLIGELVSYLWFIPVPTGKVWTLNSRYISRVGVSVRAASITDLGLAKRQLRSR